MPESSNKVELKMEGVIEEPMPGHFTDGSHPFNVNTPSLAGKNLAFSGRFGRWLKLVYHTAPHPLIEAFVDPSTGVAWVKTGEAANAPYICERVA